MPTTRTGLEPLIDQLQLSQWALMKNLEGLSNDESLSPPKPAGNTLNWVVGHVMNARSLLLQAVGRTPVWDEATGAPYVRDGAALRSSGKAKSLDAIRSDLERSFDDVIGGLRDLSPEMLDAKAPFSPTDNPDETVGSLLAGLVFHDAYHVGQTGLLRRLAGKPGAIAF